MKNLIIIIAFITLGTTDFFAQNDYYQVEKEGATFDMQQQMESYQINGAAHAVIRNFALDTTFQMGFRDRENALPVDENTIFQMGSMTQPIVKFAILRLVNDGKIELDAPANNYLKKWKITGGKFLYAKPVTVRDLLLQRRGFADVYKPKGYTSGSELPTIIQVLEGKSPANTPALKLKKDKTGENSSMAETLIMQLILEEIHQSDLATILKKEVFEPLEMNNSLIAAELSESQAQNACIGYLENGKRVEGDRRVYPELAHSGLWSTPTDFSKFVLHIFKAAKGMDNRFLSQDLAQRGIEPQRENTSLILLKAEGKNSYWGGAPKGFYSQFGGDAEQGWIVVSCTNRELAWQFVNWDLNGQGIKYATR